MEVNGKECQARKAKVFWRKDSSWKRKKIAGNLIHRPWGYGIQRKPSKNARKKLETSVALAMPCKILKNCGSGGSDKNKTKLACFLEADESTRMRWEIPIPQHHEVHIAGKGEKFTTAFSPGSQICSKLWKIYAAKAAVDKEREKIGENFGVELDESQK